MLASDRPVLVEPEIRPPSRPFRTRLGQVMRLDVLAKSAATGNLARILARSKTTGNLSAIGERSTKAAPHTARATVACWGCGAEVGVARRHRRYCEACRAQRCPECQRYASQHAARCRFQRRRRRPGRQRYGVVTVEHILDLFVRLRAPSVRLAEGIAGRLHGEDVVSEVVTYLLEHRDFLRQPPPPRYFLTAVRNTALRRLLYAWSRYVVAMDPEDLVLAEQAMEGQRRGQASTGAARLPESCRVCGGSAGRRFCGQCPR
jgi:hypothetical protein